MDGSGVKDTTAYKIIRQMTDHVWGADEKLPDEAVLSICRLFSGRRGSWQLLMNGSMDEAVRLEDCIAAVVKYRRGSIVAARIAARVR